MNKVVKYCTALFALSALTGASFAAKPGFYAGAGLGGSKLQTPNKYIFDTSSNSLKQSRPSGIGLGGRVFGGYNINEYLGVEGGFAHFANAQYKSSAGASTQSIDYTLNDFDLVAKAYLPLGDTGINLYALGGMALVHATTDYKGKVVMGGKTISPVKGSTTQNTFRPKYGVGASYDIPQSNISTSVEYSRVQGVGKLDLSEPSKRAIPTANMTTLNVSYNFG